jgi:hypothetical protein
MKVPLGTLSTVPRENKTTKTGRISPFMTGFEICSEARTWWRGSMSWGDVDICISELTSVPRLVLLLMPTP